MKECTTGIPTDFKCRASDYNGNANEPLEIKQARAALNSGKLPERAHELLTGVLRGYDHMVSINKLYTDSFTECMRKPGFLDFAGPYMIDAYDRSKKIPCLTRVQSE